MTTFPDEARFVSRTGYLIGEVAMERLGQIRVMIIGIGGVGSWAAEMLVRDGVRDLCLVDFDLVAATDFNRQTQAVRANLGRPKTEALAERLEAIAPQVRLACLTRRYESSSSEEILGERPSIVIDAIDLLSDKAHLVDACLRRGLPIVTSTGAAARLDPTLIEVRDLAFTRIDPMARALRKILKRRYGYQMEKPLGVPAVVSTEPRRVAPTAPRPDEPGPLGEMPRKKPVEGSAGCVTAAFGMAAAAVVLRWVKGQVETNGVEPI